MVSSAHALARHSNLNASEVRNIAATSCALATLSVTACALASALAWRKRKSWEMVQEVIIFILATDFGILCAVPHRRAAPGLGGVLRASRRRLFLTWSMLWSAVVADVLVRLLVFQDDRAALARRRLPYHGFVWGVSLIGTILPILGVCGPAGPWCWIDTSLGAPQAATVMRFGTVYLGIWA